MSERWHQLAHGLTLLLVLGLFALRSAPEPSWNEARRTDELARLLLRIEHERDELREETARLKDQLSAALGDRVELAMLERELETARMAAGFVAVVGPGVAVTLIDGQSEVERQDTMLVHDDDVLKVVNELAAAGAEAISVNGQRIVATTEIRCAGPVISINNTRTAPPVEILAIGNPTTLEAALRLRGGVIDRLGLWGIRVEVSVADSIEVPAYQGAIVFRHAVPAPRG